MIVRNASPCSLVTFLMIEGHVRRFCLLKPPLQSFVEGSKCFPSAWFQGCTYSLSQWVSTRIWQSHRTLATVLMTCICGFGFSNLVEIRSKKRNLLVVGPYIHHLARYRYLGAVFQTISSLALMWNDYHHQINVSYNTLCDM